MPKIQWTDLPLALREHLFERSVYTRSRFSLESLDGIETLHVGLDFDDAAAVWLNGYEIARVNLPGGPLDWNATPEGNHESSNASSARYDPVIDVTAIGLPRLTAGENVLAVAVWNVDAGSSDLALVPLLSANRPGPIEGTDLCGTLLGETVLTVAGSPYTVSCDLLVPAGSTLRIEAAVEIYFDPGVEIQVGGQIFALGLPSSRIVMTRRQIGGWSGIDIDHEDDDIPRASVLRHVDLSEASTLLDVQDTGSSSILVEDCAFDNWSSYAVDFDAANGLEVRRRKSAGCRSRPPRSLRPPLRSSGDASVPARRRRRRRRHRRFRRGEAPLRTLRRATGGLSRCARCERRRDTRPHGHSLPAQSIVPGATGVPRAVPAPGRRSYRGHLHGVHAQSGLSHSTSGSTIAYPT